MDRTPEPSPPPIADEARLETLLRQTLAERAAGVTTPPDALPRLNARLDAANPPRRWFGPLRLAGAVAAALVLLALLTPVGRLAAAGAQTAAQTIVTTVRQVTSRDGDGSTTPPRGTAPAPNATDASASRIVPTTGAGSPATGGTAHPSPSSRAGTPAGTASQVAPLSPTPRATDQPAASTPPGAAVTATATPTVAVKGTATPVGETTPSTPPAARRAETVNLPNHAPAGEEKERGE